MDKLLLEYKNKERNWYLANGFDEQGITYVYFPLDSYNRKEQLKQDGFMFNKFLFWHCSKIPAGYADMVLKISFNEIGEMSAWGEGFYYPEARKIVYNKMLDKSEPIDTSKYIWLGKENEKITVDTTVTYVKSIMGRFGMTLLLKFEDANGNELNWWSSTNKEINVGDRIRLTGTVKNLNIYRGKKITVVTRCKVDFI